MPALPSSFSCRLVAGVFAGRSFCLLGGALAICAAAPIAGAQQEGEGPGRSPFLPQGWEQQAQAVTARPTTGEAPQGSYVFNGMIQIGARTLFSIGNTQTGHAMLLELGEKSGDVQVLSYDAQRNAVSFSGAGRTEELALRKSDGEPLVVAASATPGGQRGGGMQGRPQGGAGGMGAQQGRSGPSVEFLEARRRRLDEQIERRRAEDSASGSGAVTVGGASAASGNANNAGGARASGAAMQGGAQSQGDQGNQGVRARRLRMQMNPNP